MILFLTNRIFFQHHHIGTYRLQIKIQVKKTFNFVIGGGWVQNRMPDLNCILEEQKCSYGNLMVHDFKFIFKKKIFTFVMALNTSCILLFMTVRHNKAVSTHYETDYVYRHKRESFSVANWLQLLSNDQWGPEFEYIFNK